MFDKLRYALGDAARAKQIAKSEGGGSGRKGGKHASPKGRNVCGKSWTDPGVPGSKHANYPHSEHWCGDEKHNRGDCHCWGGENWKCNATKPN